MILQIVTKTTSLIANRISAVRSISEDLFYTFNALVQSSLELAKELSITNGTNSEIVEEKLWKCRPHPSCKVWRSTTLDVPNNTVTLITYDNESYDDLSERNDKQANFWSPTVTPGRLTVHHEGKYRISGCVRFPAGGGVTGTCYVLIQKTDNAAATSTIASQSHVIVDTIMDLSVSIEDYGFPGDYYTLVAYQINSGAGILTLPAGITAFPVPTFCISGRM